MKQLQERLPAAALEGLLRRAGEHRGVADLENISTWSSYRQFRRLLEEASSVLGPSPEPTVTFWNTELAETVQALGSTGQVLASAESNNGFVPIRTYESEEIGPSEWTIREQFIDGFEPFPEYCAFATCQYRSIPILFGLPPGDVVEEECECRGDASCLFRLRWDDNASSRNAYLAVRTRLLTARIEQLQSMVTDLASNERYEDVLQGIVASTMGAASAGGALLAIEPRWGAPRKLYVAGLTPTEASSLADELLRGDSDREGIEFAKVSSARHDYGILAIGDHGGMFNASSSGILTTYARLAATALDATDAIEDARHQAQTAEALLTLSTSLAEIASTETMATTVARAALDIIDCDRAAVFLDRSELRDTSEEEVGLAGSFGYPDDLVDLLARSSYRIDPSHEIHEGGIASLRSSKVGNVASLYAPMTIADRAFGAIVVSVTSNPARLDITPGLIDRLKGLAAQASAAIANARLVDHIRYRALHDTLTGLPNRALILDRIERMLARSRRTDEAVAALFIDLDSFKSINDTLGHLVGDQLLQAVAHRLSGAMREGDSVGRLGGDEFVVVIDGTTTDVGAQLTAERLLGLFQDPFVLEESTCGPLALTASIGIAMGIRSSAAELLRDADIALYEAKAAGKNCSVVFESRMHTAIQDRHLLETELHSALANAEFFLMYQPICKLSNQETTGVEAMVRWNHPTRGVISPDTFMPILENTGLIAPVGKWALEEACRQGVRWHADALFLSVTVHVSGRQLESVGLVDDVRCALDQSGFDPHFLTLAITETAIMRDVAAVVSRLAALKAVGVRIAIDEFGTGYSSLAYLQQFPVDVLKLDRSFAATMGDLPEPGGLIQTLVQFGKTLGLETLADGIEAPHHWAQLQRAQCDSGQGNSISPPLEACDIGSYVSRTNPRSTKV